jgi:cyclopropane-fatty-acyl-phospholipid synthase
MTPYSPPPGTMTRESLPEKFSPAFHPLHDTLRTGELNGGSVPPLSRDFGEQYPRANKLVESLFERCSGCFSVRLWNGETTTFGFGRPRYTLVFNSPGALRKLALTQNPLALADAYFRCEVDIEGDFYAALALKDELNPIDLPLEKYLSTAWRGLWLSGEETKRDSRGRVMDVHGHTPELNRESIAFHYDLSNEFYDLWLDDEMVYSCAYFQRETDSLNAAQTNKLDYICRKLRLKPGDQFLDVGCGWGALVLWAARYYGVNATGITLSEAQYSYAQKRIFELGLDERVTVQLRDYRDLLGRSGYDKIASIGMFEHVGLKNLPVYFETMHRLLKPGGLFLNHGITHEQEGWGDTLSTRFINRYVFPDGELDTVSNVQRHMERARFEIWDVENLRPHYSKTLRHWVSRLETNRTKALAYVDETVYRTWRLYMAASAMQFEYGDIGVYQLLCSKRKPYDTPVPLTREDLYR